MNLKESYRYSNFLTNLLNRAYSYLRSYDFITTTTQEHLRKLSNPDAENETVVLQKPFTVDFTPNDLLDFVVKIFEEKDRLMTEISEAKRRAEINIDDAIAFNKMKQGFVAVLNGMADKKPLNKKTQSIGKKFNVEGNQVNYCYDVLETVSIDFNRNNVRGLVKKYLKETDEVSSKLDSIEINTIVNFEPRWDINDEFEDLVMSEK